MTRELIGPTAYAERSDNPIDDEPVHTLWYRAQVWNGVRWVDDLRSVVEAHAAHAAVRLHLERNAPTRVVIQIDDETGE